MENQKICLITGANSGIGKAAALRFARTGAHVVLACRREASGKNAYDFIRKSVKTASLDLMIVDLSSMDSIVNFVNEFKSKFQYLDILVHNAANFDYALKNVILTKDGFETIFSTNYLGPFLITQELMPLLKKSSDARIITVASRGLCTYPFTDLDLNDLHMKNRNFSVAKAYYNSKLAHLMYTLELAERFKSNITANCVRVTNVRLSDDRLNHLTWYQRFAYSIKSQFAISPDEMAKTYEFLAFSSKILGKTGLYFDEYQSVVPVPKKAKDLDFRRQLWNITEKMLEPWTKARCVSSRTAKRLN